MRNRSTEARVDLPRYRRVLTFFGGMMANIIWWEVVLRQFLGAKAVAKRRSQRFQQYALSFRRLAVQMGGVMIKLGQFVSARVDVMPPEIIDALSDLQDEVPPEKLEKMLPVIEAELGSPAAKVFSEFNTEVQAAASLGQVYRARLKSGERVAIKVQRPGIEHLVATDLAAVRVVARWTMLWPLISKRADVPKLIDEFARTLWEELDYRVEADNAERFRELFADDDSVYVPEVYRQFSADRVLTLEDVTSIKITDFDAIDASGVDRQVVAHRLLDVYLRMIFDFGFFHADPHPGNLFVYPLPAPPDGEMSEQETREEGQPFYIVFVDFGMVGRITDQVKRGLREALVAVGTRDTKRVLKAYQTLGVLLPSADLSRIEEAQAEAMDYAWGKSTTELLQMSRSEMHDFALKYRDLLYTMPFQVPQDFIYLARAVGMLSGMCTALDPDFNPWEPIAGYAQKLVAQEAQRAPELVVQELLSMGQVALGLPRQAQDVLSRFQEGRIEVQVAPTEGLARDMRRLESAVVGVTRALVFASLLGASTWLYTSGEQLLGEIGYGLAGIAWLTLVLRKR